MAATRRVESFRLENDAGTRATLIDWGATLVALELRDRSGRLGDVVLGFDDPERYRQPHPHFGSTVGRYANRIAAGRFRLEGRTIRLATNEGPHHLHGGEVGFDAVWWDADPHNTRAGPAVCFQYKSRDGEQGYPGNLEVTVTYTLLTQSDELRIDYEASCDAPTPVNLTHHSYFNLADGGRGDVLTHELSLNADRYTPVDARRIPTGELAGVRGTPFDFREPHAIGSRLAELGGPRAGYDHNYVLNGSGLRRAALLTEPSSGRTMELWTTQPGLQLYTANALNGRIRGKAGVPYHRHAGLCLEAQHFPDSPNRPAFPSTLLAPGQRYSHTTIQRFSTDAQRQPPRIEVSNDE